MARPASITAPEIAAQAKQLFLKQGIVRTEMKDIAEKCGISRTTLYRYYDSKESIAFYLVMEIMQEFGEQLGKHPPEGENGYERLANTFRAFVDAMVAQPDKMRLLDDFDCTFSDGYPTTEAAAQYTSFIRENKMGMSGLWEEGVADGSIRADLDLPFAAAFMTNALLGVAQRVLPRAKILKEEQGYGVEYLYATLELILRDIRAQK